MRVLIAVDKFKGSLTQTEITEIVSEFLDTKLIDHGSVNIADGGDGSIDAFVRLGWLRKTLTVTGPLANEHQADYAVSRDGKRVALEVAEICGIKYLHGNLDPYRTSSKGLGEAIAQIGPTNYEEMLICVGGSASIDGGMGVLQALTIGISDRRGRKVELGLAGLRNVFAIDSLALARQKRDLFGHCSVRILSDTKLPLLGRNGAALSFGKQKGLSKLGMIRADLALRRWFRIAKKINPQISRTEQGTGSAGGIGFVMHAFFGAKIESGSDFFVNENRVREKLTSEMTLFTGEGRIDATTLSGKTILPLLKIAKERGSKVVLLCGSAEERTLRFLIQNFPIIGVVKLSDSGEETSVLMSRAKEILAEQLNFSYRKRWFQ